MGLFCVILIVAVVHVHHMRKESLKMYITQKGVVSDEKNILFYFV